MVISEDRLSEFDQQWNKHKIILLRSPPASGKTIFLERLELYSKKKKGRVVRRISMTAVERMEAKSIDDFWKEVAGEPWSSFRTCTVPTDILIDEAQTFYGKANFFWRDIKGLVDHANPNLRVLLSMCSYRARGDDHYPHNIHDVPYELGLNCLRLKWIEFDQLVEHFINFVHKADHFELTIPMTVRDVIFNITAGHPHIVRKTLEILKDHFRHTDFKDSDMLNYLSSHEYYFAIKDLHVFDALRNLEMTNDNIEFLRNAYHHVDSDSTFPFDGIDDPTFYGTDKFQRSGLITNAHGGLRMQFAVPLMRGISGIKLFTTPISTQLPTQSADSFDAFLLLTFERMRPSILRKSLSRTGQMGSRLMERQWQMEWLTASRTAGPIDSLIIPVAGAVCGLPGHLDFYIGGKLRWGVEIITEGIESANHIAHLASGGRYINIPMNHWAIIDFRHHSAEPEELKSDVWYAMYADDYKTITVQRQGHEDKVIRLCGDWDSSPIALVGHVF